jgi:hypothetical protein
MEDVMHSHKLFALLAVVGFAGHLVADLFVDVLFWLPEYVWAASLVFAVLAIYSGTMTATRTEAASRGAAIASAVIGGLVLLGLMYSGISWLFMMGDMSGVAMHTGGIAAAGGRWTTGKCGDRSRYF